MSTKDITKKPILFIEILFSVSMIMGGSPSNLDTDTKNIKEIMNCRDQDSNLGYYGHNVGS